MNEKGICDILRGEHGSNPNLGVEEDDLLARAFFALANNEKKAFWSEFTRALQNLISAGEDLPVYLGARFLFGLSEIRPSPLTKQTALFDFLTATALSSAPSGQLAGILLAALLFKKGHADFWEQATEASLNSLEASPDARYAVAATVYAFLGYTRCEKSIPSTTWSRLFRALSHQSHLSRMELLELLVSVESEAANVQEMQTRLNEGLNDYRLSTSEKRCSALQSELANVFRAWLKLNSPHATIANWLEYTLRPNHEQSQTSSPRRLAESLAHEQTVREAA